MCSLIAGGKSGVRAVIAGWYFSFRAMIPSQAPVAFWVLNEDEDFKGGDYVTFDETVTTAVPLTVEICKKHPQSELTKIKDEIKKELSK